MHLSFCFALYRHRAANGCYFLHEHPWSAWSGKLDLVQDFMQRTDVYLGRGDQCPFGQWRADEHGPGLVLKPTGWLSSSLHIFEHVAVRCCNTIQNRSVPHHRRVHLESGRAKACQAYPPALERAIVEGEVSQLKSDKVLTDGFIGVLEPEEALHEGLATDSWSQLGVSLQDGGSAVSTAAPEEGIYIDDVPGCVLDPKLVRQARLEELQETHSFKVYEKVPISECIQVTGKKPIGSRWGDTYRR